MSAPIDAELSAIEAEDDIEISDDDLAALALGADPNAPLDSGAVPFSMHISEFPSLLPDWYMPVPATLTRTRGRGATAALIVASLLLVNALGLCVTYGFLQIA